MEHKFKVGDEVIIEDIDPEYVKAVPAYARLKGKKGKVMFVSIVSNKLGDIYYKVELDGICVLDQLDFKENELLPAVCEVTGILSIFGDI